MKLKPIATADIQQVAGWLAQKDNYQWLDFGNGTQILSPVSLKIMTQRDIHFLRLFTPDESEEPIGVIGLSNIDRKFKTASIWVVLGNKRYSGKGYPRRAGNNILTLAFADLALHAVNAWTLENNTAAIRLLERLHFRSIGRLRQCHYINGQPYDRLLFDLLASEHREI